MAYSPIINCPICGRICKSNASRDAAHGTYPDTSLREKFIRALYLHTTCYSCGINFKAGRVQTAIRNVLGVHTTSAVKMIEGGLPSRRERPPTPSFIPRSGVLGARTLQKRENSDSLSAPLAKEKPFLLEIHNRAIGLHFRIEIEGKSSQANSNFWNRARRVLGSVVSTAEAEIVNFLELKKISPPGTSELTEALQKSVNELSEAKRIIEKLSAETSLTIEPRDSRNELSK